MGKLGRHGNPVPLAPYHIAVRVVLRSVAYTIPRSTVPHLSTPHTVAPCRSAVPRTAWRHTVSSPAPYTPVLIDRTRSQSSRTGLQYLSTHTPRSTIP
eukprot:1778144-Rhodomonas_salina.1